MKVTCEKSNKLRNIYPKIKQLRDRVLILANKHICQSTTWTTIMNTLLKYWQLMVSKNCDRKKKMFWMRKHYRCDVMKEWGAVLTKLGLHSKPLRPGWGAAPWWAGVARQQGSAEAEAGTVWLGAPCPTRGSGVHPAHLPWWPWTTWRRQLWGEKRKA